MTKMPTRNASHQPLIERIVEGLSALDLGDISKDELREIVAAEVSRFGPAQGMGEARAVPEGSAPLVSSPAQPAESSAPSLAPLVAAPESEIASSPRAAPPETQAAEPRPVTATSLAPETPPQPSPITKPVWTARWLPIAIAVVAGVVLIGIIAAVLSQPQPGQAPAAPPPAAGQPAAPAALVAKPAFVPQQRFTGSKNSSPYAIKVGSVEIKNGKLTLEVGQLEGMDGVYDYVLLQAADGKELRFEAEDARYTTGDTYAQNDRADGHWWLQGYGGFSGGKGLVLRKWETAPTLTTEVQVPNGTYQLSIGSFTGDEGNGIFGLGVTIK